jgi:hypothetical protein
VLTTPTLRKGRRASEQEDLAIEMRNVCDVAPVSRSTALAVTELAPIGTEASRLQ